MMGRAVHSPVWYRAQTHCSVMLRSAELRLPGQHRWIKGSSSQEKLLRGVPYQPYPYITLWRKCHISTPSSARSRSFSCINCCLVQTICLHIHTHTHKHAECTCVHTHTHPPLHRHVCVQRLQAGEAVNFSKPPVCHWLYSALPRRPEEAPNPSTLESIIAHLPTQTHY